VRHKAFSDDRTGLAPRRPQPSPVAAAPRRAACSPPAGAPLGSPAGRAAPLGSPAGRAAPLRIASTHRSQGRISWHGQAEPGGRSRHTGRLRALPLRQFPRAARHLG
jgi:hypothetical protein